MKLKEINRTAIQSWSPAQQHPIYLATGTSAQQLDASFSTSASLEFFQLDLAEPSLDMRSCGSFSSSHRYHKLVWGPYGLEAGGRPAGVLVAGGENGNVILYDPDKIMAGDTDVVVAESDKHTGPVRALDVNPYQILKTTFESLIQKCLVLASDPQTKRKLDDANKRLETLYDKLREQTLSPAIVSGLHSIARSIECRSYADGLNIHTHIVGSSNFSETSAFMPVLKVVLTQANRLGV